MHQQPTSGTTTAGKRTASARGMRAAAWTLRAVRNVLAILGLFFVFLLYRGMTAYDVAVTSSQQDVACAKLVRCM